VKRAAKSKKSRAGREGRFKRESTHYMSASLTPEEISLLNALGVDHGGAGRAIQVAIEHLSLWNEDQHKKFQKELGTEDRSGKPEPFSFAAFPRTSRLMDNLAGYYESKSGVVRACITVLSDIKALDLGYEPNEAS
jgi:hypothetical protein